MKRTHRFSRGDLIAVWLCSVLLVVCLGAIGAGGKRRVKESICTANLRGWGQALLTFAEDNGGEFMLRFDAVWWVRTLEPYYADAKLRFCPEATVTSTEGGVNPHMAWEREHVGDVNEIYRGSYVVNLWIGLHSDEGYWRTPYVSGDVPLVLDGQWKDMQPSPADEPAAYEEDMWTQGPENEMQRACVNRHGGVNVVFMDGSVRKIGLKHLWVQRWYRGWEDDLAAVGLPAWPEWMADFKDP